MSQLDYTVASASRAVSEGDIALKACDWLVSRAAYGIGSVGYVTLT
jgi:hypothetical protein